MQLNLNIEEKVKKNIGALVDEAMPELMQKEKKKCS